MRLIALVAALPFALITASTARAAEECPPHDPQALNLDWTQQDDNGLPLNPRWKFQKDHAPSDPTDPFEVPDPSSPCFCGGFPTDQPNGVPDGYPRCTDQTEEDLPRGLRNAICQLEFLIDGRRNVARGHINYLPVSYVGRLHFASKSIDQDYCFELLPLERATAGLVARRPGLTVHNLRHDKPPHTLHVEFREEEVIDHFSQPWWVKFRKQVKKLWGGKGARKMVEASPAMVIGLFGLDAEHGGHSELHPIHAMAFRTRCAEKPDGGWYKDRWAIMVATAGNQGMCSSWTCQHHLDVADNTLTLSLPFLPTATEISFRDGKGKPLGTGPGDSRKTELFASAAGVEGPQLVMGALGPAARFRWPSTVGRTDVVRIHGEVNVWWRSEGGPSRDCRLAITPPAAAPPTAQDLGGASAIEDEGAEGFLASLQGGTRAGRVADQDRRGAPPEKDKVSRPVGLGALILPSGLEKKDEIDDEAVVPGVIPDPGLVAVKDRKVCPSLPQALQGRNPDDNRLELAAVCEAARERRRSRQPLSELDRKRIDILLDYCKRNE